MSQRVWIVLMLLLLSNRILYADEVPMPENTPRPLKIGVAVFVNNITKVDDQAGTFEGSLDLQLRWKNPVRAFNPQEMGTNRIEFNHDAATKKIASIWTPALTLTNATIQSVEQGLFIYADGTVVLIQRLKGIFNAKYRLEAFPFDIQNLPIHIASERYNTNQITLIQEQRDINNSGLSKEISLLSWQPKRLTFVRSQTRGWNGQFFPEMQAQIVLARLPTAYLLATLMPFFLVILIPTIATFFIKLDMDKRLGYCGSSILALVALSFTYSSRYAMLPPKNITMELILIGSGYQIVMILLAVTLFNPHNANRWFSNKFIIPEIVSYLRWAIPLALIGLVLTRVMLISLTL
jgi:hypothetical protein